VALLLGLLTLLLIGLGTGLVPFLIGFVLATLPVPIYVALALWIDRYEPEPPWTLATAFFWGALVAIFIAFVMNTISGTIVALLAGDQAGELFATVISAPFVEETSKALVLFGLFYFKRDEFDGVIDGIVYAAMVGLGFAMTENIQYYGGAVLHGGIAGSVATFILRGMLAPFSHPLFTSMTGIGLGLASLTTKRGIRLLAPLAGLFVAMSLHGLWNLSASLSTALYFVVYLLIMVPVFIAVLVTIYYALKREGRIVREQMLTDMQQGFFTPQDYECLCSVRGRMGASWQAFRHGGVTMWRVRARYHSAASELAFHRNRIARGLLTPDEAAQAREELYRRALSELSAQMGQPR
ncbi:MAG TPA: PrsW family glutamic-type intramembrane protease, partial [Pyrinomonadaceae bacterium]|nr:PrsW family glutamic-type intramembrane protease [Pyrinomonadaceae bacterium]